MINVNRIGKPGAALASLVVALGMLAGCNKGADKAPPREAAGASKGVGPVQSLSLAALDAGLAAQGEKLFSGTCAACHKFDQRYVGPALSGVTRRRAPEWIMNMILNPAEMTQKDETAKALLGEYLTQMSVNVKQEDARAILEYFRKMDGT